MSTYINTNTTAMMASFNLDNNTTALNGDIEQLSTGLRINSAADDAAGLVRSENMAAQLSGLNQATSNTNDAINMTKTAEGALNQVQNLLVSMRQLAVQASNLGVNDSTDVQADQTQIASAIQSINRISSTTQFGTKYLLNGSSSSAMTTTNGSAAASSGSNFAVVAQGSWSTGNSYDYTSAQLSQATATTSSFATTTIGGSTPATLSATNTNVSGSIKINGTSYNVAATTGNNFAAFNTAIAGSGYQASFNASGNMVFTASTAGATAAPAIDMSGLTVAGSVSDIATTATDATNTSTFAAAAGTGGSLPHSLASVSASTNIAVSGTLALTSSTGATFSKTYAAGTSINQVQQDLDSTFGTGADAVTASTSASGALVFTDATAAHTLTSTGSDLAATNTAGTLPSSATNVPGAYAAMTLSDGAGHTMTSNTTQVVNGSSYYSFQNGLVLSSSAAASLTGTTNVNGALQGTAGATSTGTDLEFQIGANGGQTASLSIGSTAADQLGKGAASYTDANGTNETVLTGSVADVNVTTFKGAQDAIAVLDKAISDISTDRANLGAFQSNVLQSNVQSLGVATTNLSAAESTIKDTDLATTIVDYTKNQILVSSATSALSYANQEPQSILKLLQ